MAAPHVAGAAALLMARHPELIGRPLAINARSGRRAVVQAPTWSASVDTLRLMPSCLYRSLWRFSG